MYQLPPDRFYATYFEGDEKLGLAPDEEARQLWLKYLPAERVIPGNAHEDPTGGSSQSCYTRCRCTGCCWLGPAWLLPATHCRLK